MLALLPHLRSLRNSPTSARDLSQILSPIRLGLWFTFFNIAVAIAFTTLFGIISQANNYPNSFDSRLFTSVELGQLFASVLFYTIAIFLTVFVPLRIFGFLIGPRTHRYLDQIIISGISPSRYIAGKVILQNLFFLIIVAASIPYLALCFSLGGVSFTFVLVSIVGLWLYTNLLCLVCLGASVLTFEFVAVPAVILFFGFALWIGILPIPPNPLSFTPAPLFASPVYQNLLADDNPFSRDLATVFTYTEPLGLLATHLLFYLFTVGLLGAALFLYLSIGPLAAIHGPLTNFGSVVMPGDAKKRRVFRGHQTLRRRGEIAFFYENRPARLRRHDLPFRWGLKAFLLLCLIVPAAIYAHYFAPLFWEFEFYASLLTAGIILVIINAFVFTRDRATANLRYPKMSAATADTLFFFGATILVFFAIFASPYIRETYGGGMTFGRPARGFLSGTFPLNFLAIGLVVAVSITTFYALAQWLTVFFWSHFRAFFTAAVIYGIAIAVPIFVFVAVDSTSRFVSDGKIVAGHFATLSPIVQIGQLLDERAVRLPFTPAIWPFLIAHIAAAALFFGLARRFRKRFPAVPPS